MTTSHIRGLVNSSTVSLFEARVCSSNDILSSQDEAIVRKLLAEEHNEMVTLDIDIARHEEALDQLKRRRSSKTERVERLRTGIAPHKKLPPEILAKIFVESLDRQKVYIPASGPDNLPWSLGQVCSRWREISRSVPELWSDIDVDSLSSEPILSLVDAVLSQHGGQGKLDISLRLQDDEDWMATLKLVEKHTVRLRGLHLAFENSRLSPLATPLKSFDEVHSLSLSFCVPKSRPPNEILNSAFSTAPHLRKIQLSLNPYLRVIDVTGKMLPWARLTDITLFGVSGPPALVALRHCSLLINLNVSLPDIDIHSYTETVSFPRLRSISISAYSEIEHILELLAHLILPSLKSMALDTTWPTFMPWRIIEVIECSTCHLESFRTKNIDIASMDLIPMLRIMPALKLWGARTAPPISELVFSMIIMEKLAPNLRVIQGWGVLSVHSAMNFLNNQWLRTASESYEGIDHSMMWISKQNYGDDDARYIESILLDMKRKGRSVQFMVR